MDVIFNDFVSESRKVLTVLISGSCHIFHTSVTSALVLARVFE